MPSSDTPARDAVLVKYLNEAFGKEKQLETNLVALIGRAQNHKSLKKGLQDHLKVTKNQSRELQKRIRELGGKATVADVPGPEVATTAASAVTNVANRALAAAKGPVQMLRGTGEADNMLRNVRDALWNEAEEIAHYDVIEAVATKLSDRETAALAKRFRREEERMQKFLGRQLKALVGEVVRDEVPAAERRSGSARTPEALGVVARQRRGALARGLVVQRLLLHAPIGGPEGRRDPDAQGRLELRQEHRLVGEDHGQEGRHDGEEVRPGRAVDRQARHQVATDIRRVRAHGRGRGAAVQGSRA